MSEHFTPVDETADFGGRTRRNFIIINANFRKIGEGFEMVNVGGAPNDGTGDELRTAWQKVNRNFARLEQALK